MCNRYRPPNFARYRNLFDFRRFEQSAQLLQPAGIGPLQRGPFIRPGGEQLDLVAGQWGLIPQEGKTRRRPPARDGYAAVQPLSSQGKPLATNNARFDQVKGKPERWSFTGPWMRGQRCLVPVEAFEEPYWGHGGPRCVWWTFARRDGEPLMLAGLWNDWTEPETGEIVSSFTMLTINCNAHPLLSLMHRPDTDAEERALPPDQQDKRTVVALERADWTTWLHGSPDAAAALVGLPASDLYAHGPSDPSVKLTLPLL